MKKLYSKCYILLVFSILILSGCKERLVAAGAGEELTSPPVEFTLMTSNADGRIVYVGVGGESDGVINPDLVMQSGEAVRITLINGDGMLHDLSVPDFNAKTALIGSKGKSVEVNFTIGEDQSGVYSYFCTQPGHRQAGQEGRLVVSRP
jgi:nitrite reductase (NO-forming)